MTGKAEVILLNSRFVAPFHYITRYTGDVQHGHLCGRGILRCHINRQPTEDEKDRHLKRMEEDGSALLQKYLEWSAAHPMGLGTQCVCIYGVARGWRAEEETHADTDSDEDTAGMSHQAVERLVLQRG